MATCGSDGTLKVIDIQTATLLFSTESKEDLRYCPKLFLSVSFFKKNSFPMNYLNILRPEIYRDLNTVEPHLTVAFLSGTFC